MGSGKSTVGALLAAVLGRDFIDLDAALEQGAGATVPEIFAREGEAGFRARESQALERAAAAGPAVVAVGGGAPCHGDNLERMLAAGTVVCLSATADEIVERLGDAAGRPMLAGAADLRTKVASLLTARQPFYARAHLTLETGGQLPSEVARRIAEAVSCP